jgi:hypothetical protein
LAGKTGLSLFVQEAQEHGVNHVRQPVVTECAGRQQEHNTIQERFQSTTFLL